MMAEPRKIHWAGITTYAIVALGLIFLQLLPLDTRPVQWPAPDILLSFTIACAIRRPEYLPVGIVAVVFFLADLLFQRPPGLMTALVVMATDLLRRQSHMIRSSGFPTEWLNAALTVTAIFLLDRLALLLLFAPLPPLRLVIILAVLTILTYPLVALFTGLALNWRIHPTGQSNPKRPRT